MRKSIPWLILGVLFVVSGYVVYKQPTEAEKDKSAIERVVGKNLIPTPAPIVVTHTDPKLTDDIEALKKEVQGLR